MWHQHVASEGRRRRQLVLADRRRGKIGRSAADPIAFKNDLLVTNPLPGSSIEGVGWLFLTRSAPRFASEGVVLIGRSSLPRIFYPSAFRGSTVVASPR